jgi:glucose dehydrogenase
MLNPFIRIKGYNTPDWKSSSATGRPSSVGLTGPFPHSDQYFLRMIFRPVRIGLLFLASACARQGSVRLFLDCNSVGYCTDQFGHAYAPSPASDSEWPAYGRTPYGDRHSPLNQIDTGNVSRLEVAWRFHTGEGAPEFRTRSPTALEVTAYDMKNGRELWKATLPAGGKATPMTYQGADGRQYASSPRVAMGRPGAGAMR